MSPLLLATFLLATDLPPDAGFAPNHLFVVGSHAGVVEFDAKGKYVRTFAETVEGAPFAAAAFGPDGLLYLASPSLDEVVWLDVHGTPYGSVDVTAPADVAFGDLGHLVVPSGTGTSVVTLGTDGIVRSLWATSYDPGPLAIDPSGRLLVLETSGAAPRPLYEHHAGGVKLLSVSQAELDVPTDLVLGPKGHLFVTDATTSALIELDANLAFVDAHQAGKLATPGGVVFGPDGDLYVTSMADDVIHVVSPDGALVRTFGEDAGLSAPRALAFAPFAFRTKLSGTLADGVALGAVDAGDAELRIAPGSGVVTLRYAPDPATPSLVTDLVFHGFEARSNGKKRVIQGSFSRPQAGVEGTASLSLEVTGKTKKGAYQVHSAKGTLLRVSGEGSLRVEVTTKKPLKH